MGTRAVAIIPARGGSKRIPKKNIRPFNGRPMISYPIRAAKEAGIFDKIIVSTDSVEIEKVAVKCGAEVPFLRPKELSDDYTPTAPVIVHAISALQEMGYEMEYVCCIYATAVFIRPEHLREGLEIMEETGASSVFSVTTFDFPIFRALKINDQGHLEMIWPEYELTRSNDLPEAYHDAGQFYWLKKDEFMRQKRIYTKDARPVVIPRKFVEDIDTLEDWESAEIKYRVLMEREARYE